MAKNLTRLNVIDVESTCWEKSPPPGQHNEIIEIGIAVVDLTTRKIIKNDTMLVLPATSQISEFCTKLTTLTPEMIQKDGISFQQACSDLRSKYNSSNYTWASWGDYDRRQFERQCKREGIKYPFGITHLNLKNLHAIMLSLSKETGMDKALELSGIKLEGTHHRAIDDAHNIAKIASAIFSYWDRELAV